MISPYEPTLKIYLCTAHNVLFPVVVETFVEIGVICVTEVLRRFHVESVPEDLTLKLKSSIRLVQHSVGQKDADTGAIMIPREPQMLHHHTAILSGSLGFCCSQRFRSSSTLVGNFSLPARDTNRGRSDKSTEASLTPLLCFDNATFKISLQLSFLFFAAASFLSFSSCFSLSSWSTCFRILDSK